MPRLYSTKTIFEKLREIIPKQREFVKTLREKHGSKSLGNVTVDMAFGGMRGIKGLVYETSMLDADEGIRFRGYSIPECRKLLPRVKGSSEPLPEGILWLLLTGEIPTEAEVTLMSSDLERRSRLISPDVLNTIANNFPKTLHPMSKLSAGMMLCQNNSVFAKEYSHGKMTKENYWIPTLEDVLNIVAILPTIAATINNSSFGNVFDIKKVTNVKTKDGDLSAAFCKMLGSESPALCDLLRLYLCIHSDHEGGNVSAHTTHLVGSALSDPYLSYAAGLNGLAGPLHGLANQEVLHWLLMMHKEVGNNPTNKTVTDYVWKTLRAGQVVPGYGHAVLRKTDPRYTCQREFALKHLPDDPLFRLVSQLYSIVPKVLEEHGKTNNPWPNVDAHSGVLLHHYNLRNNEFYTVLFGVSRAIGALSGLVWDRALMFPLERPKSLTSKSINAMFEKMIN